MIYIKISYEEALKYPEHVKEILAQVGDEGFAPEDITWEYDYSIMAEGEVPIVLLHAKKDQWWAYATTELRPTPQAVLDVTKNALH